jgi:hypothetical protein
VIEGKSVETPAGLAAVADADAVKRGSPMRGVIDAEGQATAVNVASEKRSRLVEGNDAVCEAAVGQR